jgi:endonuclease/exonuclease/phosphatase family metal-dependent hydrolase
MRSYYLPVCSTGRPKELLASKGLLWAELSHGGRALRVGNVHLGIGSAEAQRRQHDDLLGRLDTLGQVHLLCGDFNQASAPEVQRDGAGHPHSRYLGAQLGVRGYRDALIEIHGPQADRMLTADSDRNSLLAPGFHLRLDYIWTRSDEHIQLEPIAAQIWLDEPRAGTCVSDHFGVRAELTVQHGQ